jgi:hypothetical protein
MNNERRVVFIFAGSSKYMDEVLTYAPAIATSAPLRFNIPDFSEKEILHTIVRRIRGRYRKKMNPEDGETGKYVRIVARRISRTKGSDSFCNMRTVHNTLIKIYQRQAKRLEGARTQRPEPDDFSLTRDDLLGPAPRSVFDDEEAWKELEEMVGLESVKLSVRSFIDRLHLNYCTLISLYSVTKRPSETLT